MIDVTTILEPETIIAVGGAIVGVAGTVYGLAQNVKYETAKRLFDEYVEATDPTGDGGTDVTPKEAGEILDAAVDVYRDMVDEEK